MGAGLFFLFENCKNINILQQHVRIVTGRQVSTFFHLDWSIPSNYLKKTLILTESLLYLSSDDDNDNNDGDDGDNDDDHHNDDHNDDDDNDDNDYDYDNNNNDDEK
jgi:ABC-type Zn2+ transport system substrate-binding protein/surface adhesin